MSPDRPPHDSFDLADALVGLIDRLTDDGTTLAVGAHLDRERDEVELAVRPLDCHPLTALAGCGAVLNVVATPFTLNVRPDPDGAGISAAAALGFALLMLWSIVITGHILRHALSTSFFFGLVLAIVFNLISNQVLQMIFETQPTVS